MQSQYCNVGALSLRWSWLPVFSIRRPIGSGVTSKAMALPIFRSPIFCLKLSSNAAASLSEVLLSVNKQVKGPA